MFFAPSQIVKRNQDWGPEQYQSRLKQATERFLARVDDWIKIDEYEFDNMAAVYDEVLHGATPDKAYIVVL